MVFAIIYFFSVGHIYIFFKTEKERGNSDAIKAKHIELEEAVDQPNSLED